MTVDSEIKALVAKLKEKEKEIDEIRSKLNQVNVEKEAWFKKKDAVYLRSQGFKEEKK